MSKLQVGTVLEFEREGRFSYSQVVLDTPTLPWLFNFTDVVLDSLSLVELGERLANHAGPPRLSMVAVGDVLASGPGIKVLGIFPVRTDLARRPRTRAPRPGSARAGRPEWIVTDPGQDRPRYVPEPLPSEIASLPTSQFLSAAEYESRIFGPVDREQPRAEAGGSSPGLDLRIEFRTRGAARELAVALADRWGAFARWPAQQVMDAADSSALVVRFLGVVEANDRLEIEDLLETWAAEHDGEVTDSGIQLSE